MSVCQSFVISKSKLLVIGCLLSLAIIGFLFHLQRQSNNTSYEPVISLKYKKLEQPQPAKGSHHMSSIKETQSADVKLTKKFLYLTQTGECILPQMKEGLGNAVDCQCDVLILSYKKPCQDTSLPHVTYMFKPGTTWTTGRTDLYNFAKKLGKNYLYYIVMDDDIIPVVDDKQKSGWREFEKFLLRVEPPLAALDNEAWHLVGRIYNERGVKGCLVNGSYPEYFLVRWFDGEMNAFHSKAIEYIFEPVLPYWNRYDKRSWWISQWYVNFMTDIAFHGQSVLPSRIFGSNPIHRGYPKGLHDLNVLQTIADDIRLIVPTQYHKGMEVLLQKWIPSYVNILQTVPDTFCEPIPDPHQELIPYKHLPDVI